MSIRLEVDTDVEVMGDGVGVLYPSLCNLYCDLKDVLAIVGAGSIGVTGEDYSDFPVQVLS